jgi:multiple sugar transport system ATP-binding protein
MANVVFEAVSKHFGRVKAVDDLTLEVLDQEFLVLLGPSGCGKSTVLRLVAGLEEDTSGEIAIGDRSVGGVDPMARDIAMVFQSYALYPHLTVRENMEFPLKNRKVSKDEQKRLVAEAAAMLGLSELLDRRPGQLSGGQRQRVALGRAIVRRPQVFLMDEPLSNLDAKLRVQTRAELVELHRRLNVTMMYVTHDQVEAMTMGSRIAVLNEGILQQLGSPQDVYDRPANLFVAGFIGSPPMNTVRGELVREGDGVRVQIPGGSVPLPPAVQATVASRQQKEIVLGVRPEHLQLNGGPVAARVGVVESLGHERHVVCHLPDGAFVTVRVSTDTPAPQAGETVHLTAGAEHLHLFEPETGRRLEA